MTISKTNEQLVEGVLDEILEGKSLREALKAAGVTPQTFAKVVNSEHKLAVAYARALEMRSDLMADDIIAIADGDDDPNKARNRIQARQWIVSKLHSKKYGERIDVNVSQSISINTALDEAKARLRSISDLSNVEDAQVIEPLAIPAAGATDMQSVPAPTLAHVPDIFK